MSDTSRRRSAFIAAWQSHGNVRRAMREAGVRSPTTAYRWIRAFERDVRHGPPILVSSSAPRIAHEIADQIIASRQRNPAWGKERIARHLARK